MVNIENSDLAKIGTATDILRELPRVDVGSDGTVNVFAKGTPLIYINNKQVRSNTELEQLKSNEVKSVELITAPGAKYDATVQSVIRIKTIKKQGEGWSGENYAQTSYNKYWAGYEDLELGYHTDKLEVFGEAWLISMPHSFENTLTNQLNGSKEITVVQACPMAYRTKSSDAKVGFDYTFDESNSLGMTYEYDDATGKGYTLNNYQEIFENGERIGYIDRFLDERTDFGPTQNLNAFFLGKIGKLGIDFNGTYVSKKQSRDMSSTETSDDVESRNVHTRNDQHSKMLAGKLMFSYPIWKGSLHIGTELTSSQIRVVMSMRKDLLMLRIRKSRNEIWLVLQNMQCPLAICRFMLGLDTSMFGQTIIRLANGRKSQAASIQIGIQPSLCHGTRTSGAQPWLVPIRPNAPTIVVFAMRCNTTTDIYMKEAILICVLASSAIST